MKLGIIILLALGLVAAGSAAVLVTAMQAKSANAQKVENYEVAVLNKDLSAMVVVTLNDIDKQTLPRNEVPVGAIINPTLAVGRVLAVPVVKGQILTESCFVSQGTGAQLAAALPEGMRAFTVYLATKAIPDRLLLYPGCSVDVLYTAKLATKDSRGQAMSATILRGIQVLAVQGDSVVSNPQAEEGSTTTAARSTTSGGLQVTLLVDPKQAEALQLAIENGSISLTVRNPLDKNMGEMDATILNQDQLTLFGSAMTLEALSAAQQAQQQEQMRKLLAEMIGDANVPSLPAAEDSETAAQTQQNITEQPAASQAQSPQADSMEQTAWTQIQPAQQQTVRPRWGVIVISGSNTKTEEFLLPQSGSSGAN